MTPQETKKLFKALGLRSRMDGASYGGDWFASSGDWLEVHSPTSGDLLAKIQQAGEADYAKLMEKADQAFRHWRAIPAPKRGRLCATSVWPCAPRRESWDDSFPWRWVRFSPRPG